MDCIHYKVREDGRILSRAAYVVLGVTTEGYKEILSITVGANEASKFWLGMLNDLKNRGLKDVLFFCVDGLSGFKEAISAVYPQTQIQRCVIHMLRNSFKYVNYSDLKKFSSDFKVVYNAPNETAAYSELEGLKEKWGRKYPYAIRNWENNWEDISSFFQFSEEIRKIMYTTYTDKKTIPTFFQKVPAPAWSLENVSIVFCWYKDKNKGNTYHFTNEQAEMLVKWEKLVGFSGKLDC